MPITPRRFTHTRTYTHGHAHIHGQAWRMASPVRSGADGQYTSPTREGLTALSLMLTYLFNSTNGKDVCCLQGTPPCWDVCVVG
jgi:hypothetical protein